MILLILIYFLCRAFYRLALNHNRSGWRCATSGFVVFYVWSYISSVLFLSGIELWKSGAIASIPDMVVDLISILFGLVMTWFYYANLKEAFRKTINTSRNGYWLIW